MCQVTFWTHNDKGGDIVPFDGPRCNIGGAPSKADSLETDWNGWLIVFSEDYFKGDHMKVAAGTYLSDLNNVSRDSGGDWKHQVHSFVLYSEQQFWDAYVAGEPPVAPVHDGEVVLGPGYFSCTGTSPLIRLTGNVQIPDYQSTPTGTTSDNMIGNLGAIACGAGMYAVVFDEPDFGGNCLRSSPGTTHYNFEYQPRGDSKSGVSWARAARSLYITDHEPANWTMYLERTDFEALFPDHTDTYGYQTGTLDYTTQDCSYRLHYPFQSYPDEQTMTVNITVEHLIDFGSNDTMTLLVAFDPDGAITSVSGTWQDSDGGYVIPNWVIGTVDLVAQELGLVDAWVSLGISEVVADGVMFIFDISCSAYNLMVSKAADMSETDGGKYYMIPLAVHVILREALSVYKGSAPLLAVDNPQAIELDHNTLAATLDANDALSVTSGKSGDTYTWQQWSGTTGPLNSYVAYSRTSGDETYRTWYSEVTALPAGLGLFASCKIDYIRGGADKDDHILLMMGFLLDAEGTPCPVFAQASVQFGGASDENIVGTPIKSATPGDTDFAQAITDQLQGIIQDEDFGWINDSTDSRNLLPQIAGDNVAALVAAVQRGD